MRYFLSNHLAEMGVATVPASYFVEGSSHVDDFAIIRGLKTLGSIHLTQDPRNGINSLMILDARKNPVAESAEVVIPCSTGLCRETKLTVWVRGIPSTLTAVWVPGEYISYYIGPREVGAEYNITLWRAQFSDHLDWVFNIILDDTQGIPLSPVSHVQAFALVLAADPVISPYLPHLALDSDPYGRVVIRGRINTEIYNLIVERAISSGFYDIVPEVTLDSAFRLWPVPPMDLRACH